MPRFDCALGIFTVKTLHSHQGMYFTYGGFGHYLAAMRESFADVVLFAHVRHTPPGPGFYEIPGGNLRVVELPYVRGELQTVRALPKVWRRAKRGLAGVDLVHARMPDYTGIVGALLARRASVPCFIQVIADWATQGRAIPWTKRYGLGALLKLHMAIYDRFERSICRGQLVFAQGTAAYEKHRANADAHLVCSSAHHESDIVPARPRFQSRVHRILNVARLTSEKNQQLLIRALAALRADGGNWELVLVGEGPQESRLRGLSRELGVADFVEFTGMVQRGGRLWQCFDEADLFILPSRSEGTPKVLLEAMARGLPVVAAAVGGVPSIVSHDHNGLLFRDNSLDDLLLQMKRVAGDHSLALRLATSATSTAREHTIGEETRRMLELVQQRLLASSEPCDGGQRRAAVNQASSGRRP